MDILRELKCGLSKIRYSPIRHYSRFCEKRILLLESAFSLRFWQYGTWIEIVVDDLLPTRGGRLVYMRSETRDEFWSALLEKAYAKLHGSYEALRGGTTCEAMVDFSGGCSEHYELCRPPKDMFTIMMKAYDRSTMISCSLEPQPGEVEARTKSGLVRGHAYSLTKVGLIGRRLSTNMHDSKSMTHSNTGGSGKSGHRPQARTIPSSSH